MKDSQIDKKSLLISGVLLGIGILLAIGVGIVLECVDMELYLQIILTIVLLLLILVPAIIFLCQFRLVGYFKCGNCGHEFVPDKKRFFLSIHIGTSYLLTCPKCGQKTLCSKYLTNSKRD